MNSLPDEICEIIFLFMPANIDITAKCVSKHWEKIITNMQNKIRRDIVERFNLCLLQLPKKVIYEYHNSRFGFKGMQHPWAAKHVFLSEKLGYRTILYNICNWRVIFSAHIFYNKFPRIDPRSHKEEINAPMDEEACICAYIISEQSNIKIKWEDVTFPRGTNPENIYPPYIVFDARYVDFYSSEIAISYRNRTRHNVALNYESCPDEAITDSDESNINLINSD